MMTALLARLGFEGGLKLSRIVVVLALLALAALGYWRGMAAIERMVETARAEAIAARDAHWMAEIEKSNAAVDAQRLAAEHMAQQRSAIAEAEIAGLRATLSELEKSNAALPNGAGCGLDRDRVRLLNR